MQEVVSDHVRESKAASARTDAAASRERTLSTQLSAREEEVAALREQLSLVAKEMETWRENGKALNAKVDAVQRARDADAGKLAVAAKQARMHEDAAQTLRVQLLKMGEKECGPYDGGGAAVPALPTCSGFGFCMQLGACCAKPITVYRWMQTKR